MRLLCTAWFIAIHCAVSLHAAQPLVDSIAGTGSPQNNGNAGKASAINIGDPFGVEVGPDEALYVTEIRNHRVLRIDLDNGGLTTVAGSGQRGYSGDGGLAVEAELNEPYEVRFDADGNMYFVEMKNHVIRRVDAKTKKISTIAGAGQSGFSGDGGPAKKAQFAQPHSIALDDHGALYVADIGNHRIRKINLKTGIVETIAGNGDRKLPSDGQVARGNPILGPRALFVEGDTLWITLREGHSVWRMNLADGILHHVAGTGKAGYSGDNGPAATATFDGPKGIAVDSSGNIFVADSENHAIRRIDAKTGVITTIAGGHDSKRPSQLGSPHGICIAADGTLFIGDTANHRVARVR